MFRKSVTFVLLALLFYRAAGTVLADDWATYRADNHRSGISQERLRPPLYEQWTFTPTHPPSHAWADPQPKAVEEILEFPRLRFDDAFHVAAVRDMVYFGSSSDNKVYALDAGSGRIRWEFYTDGPVRLAPTVWKGKVYVGSDDGKVYSLNGRNGQVVWTFSGAPQDRRVLGNGKMISIHPVRTGVLVDEGVAYFGAGVFPAEGLFLYAVDATTGKLLWKNDTYGNGGLGTVSPQGYMLASNEKLFVPSGRTMPAAFSRGDGRFLFHRNFSWRGIGLFGGTYNVLSGDVLWNAASQLLGVDESDGQLIFTEGLPARVPSEGSRRLVVGGKTMYLLTGEKVLAVRLKDWLTAKRAISHREGLIADLKTRIEDLKTRESAEEEGPGEESAEEGPGEEPADEESDREGEGESPEEELADLEALLKRDIAQLERLKARISETTLWAALCESNDAIALAKDVLFVGGGDRVRGFDPSSGEETFSAKVGGRARGLAIAHGRLFVSTDTGNIHCFARGRRDWGRKVTPRIVPDPFPDDRMSKFYREAADAILTQSGINRGYALILGCGKGRLGLELARRSDMLIYAIDPDEKKVSTARKALSAAGVYGSKVIVERGPLGAPGYCDYFANLIVSQESFLSGRITTAPAEVLRMLKPCGGIALIGPPPNSEQYDSKPVPLESWIAQFREALNDLGETGTKIEQEGDWVKITRGPLNGAGKWTHQYADAGNTACSDDRHVRGPIGVLWFGEPGPGRMPSRHASNSAPLAIGGRMFIQGENVVMAYDAYNGLLLWEREIPPALRVGLKTGCSNLAANDDSLFVAVDTKCLRLDAATGETTQSYYCPPYEEGGEIGDWDYIACVDSLLYGTSDNRIFAVDIETGDVKWIHEGKRIAPSTICTGDNRLFVVDRSVTEDQQARAMEGITHEMRLDRRGEPIEPDVRLVVALDARTGEELWTLPQYVSDCVGIGSGGGELTTMYANDVLLLCGQPWNGHFWDDFLSGQFSRRSLIALDASNGKMLWSGRKGYRIRPIIVGDQIIAEPWAYDLKTGKDKLRTHPVTGAEEKWQMSRPGHHCGNIAAGPNALFFRSGSSAYYDLIGDYGTAHFGAQRPGCWINCIPANGVVLMPEASSGCICPFAVHCTMVFAPRQINRVWGMFSAPGPMMPVKSLAVNLGAPGDRRDTSGKLWLSYPRPGKGRLVMDLDLQVEGGSYFARNPEFLRIEGTKSAWVYSYGCSGMTALTVPLTDEADAPAKYTLRLHFAETEYHRPSQRVFDVKAGDRSLLKDFDIVAAAGGPYRTIVKEFRGIDATNDLTLTFTPGEGEPILCGLEVMRE